MPLLKVCDQVFKAVIRFLEVFLDILILYLYFYFFTDFYFYLSFIFS